MVWSVKLHNCFTAQGHKDNCVEIEKGSLEQIKF